ncbi:hypothetical protein AMTR_s00085p00077250 [Amborella trichopoda]|uniref:Secreted protein n=1 Tax=Amborella trichopoda TaxID=13333 RepID=W1P428_AMBTC|nr:hypothetical protein AMTR_s00085p00077250 [Amborella trichopoda]
MFLPQFLLFLRFLSVQWIYGDDERKETRSIQFVPYEAAQSQIHGHSSPYELTKVLKADACSIQKNCPKRLGTDQELKCTISRYTRSLRLISFRNAHHIVLGSSPFAMRT